MYSIINRYFIHEMWKFMIGLFIITGICTGLILYFLWSKIMLDYEEPENIDYDDGKKRSIIDNVIDLIKVCIIGPYIETIIIQYSIFKLIEIIYKGSSEFLSIAFIISTVVFAGVHSLPNKDWKGAIMRLPLSLSLSYIFSLSIINNLNPINNTAIFHAIWNTLVSVLVPMGGYLIIYLKEEKIL